MIMTQFEENIKGENIMPYIIEIVIIAGIIMTTVYLTKSYMSKEIASIKTKEWFEGYDHAVRSITDENIYYDTEKHKYIDISIASIDGKTTPFWEDAFNRYYMLGHHAAFDTMYKCGVMNRRTAEKFKWRYEKNQKVGRFAENTEEKNENGGQINESKA